MGRRRWVYIKGEAIEVSTDYVPEPKASHHPLSGDRHYDGLRTVDGVNISTRTKHRQYMKDHGVTVADDYKGEWAKAAEKRAEHYTTGAGDRRERRAQIERALYDHLNKRR